MDIDAKLEAAIEAAIDRANSQLPPKQRIDKAKSTALAGSSLDSLSLVILIAEVESQVEELFDIELALTEREDLFLEEGPLRTIHSLTSFVGNRIRERANG